MPISSESLSLLRILTFGSAYEVFRDLLDRHFQNSAECIRVLHVLWFFCGGMRISREIRIGQFLDVQLSKQIANAVETTATSEKRTTEEFVQIVDSLFPTSQPFLRKQLESRVTQDAIWYGEIGKFAAHLIRERSSTCEHSGFDSQEKFMKEVVFPFWYHHSEWMVEEIMQGRSLRM